MARKIATYMIEIIGILLISTFLLDSELGARALDRAPASQDQHSAAQAPTM